MTQDNSSAQLLPCPFDCGDRIPPVPSGQLLGTAEELQTATDQWAYSVRCCCGVQGPERSTEAEAIAAWNTRAPVSQDTEQLVERLRDDATKVHHEPMEAAMREAADLIEALTRPQPSTSSVEAVARAELLEWASQHSNVTPLDGTDLDSPTFGDLRAALTPPTAQSEKVK